MNYEIKTLSAMRLATVPHTGPYHEIGSAFGLVEDRIDGGKYACLVHMGPYEGLPGAWMKMRDALGGAGNLGRRQAPAWEIYWNDPSRVKPAELKTEICVPVE